MIDSHALVGSCAQIGERVHLSAAAQIGGVLEPVNASPVVIEDDVLVGGNCGVYEGTVVRARAVLARRCRAHARHAGVRSRERDGVLARRRIAPLEIPEPAPSSCRARGTCPRRLGRGAADSRLQTPVIVKYRDEKTDLATALEVWLR